MEQAFQWVIEHGYPALFGLLALGVVGLPIPDETLLTLTGAMVAHGEMHGAPALAAAAGGSMCGITISYGIGWFASRWLVSGKRGWRKRLAGQMGRGSEWFRLHGPPALIGGYYVPGIRHVTALVAGASRLQYRTFALYAYAGALLWTMTFLGIGWFAGEQWERVTRALHGQLKIVKVALAVAAIAYLLVWIRSHRRLSAEEGGDSRVE